MQYRNPEFNITDFLLLIKISAIMESPTLHFLNAKSFKELTGLYCLSYNIQVYNTGDHNCIMEGSLQKYKRRIHRCHDWINRCRRKWPFLSIVGLTIYSPKFKLHRLLNVTHFGRELLPTIWIDAFKFLSFMDRFNVISEACFHIVKSKKERPINPQWNIQVLMMVNVFSNWKAFYDRLSKD